MQDDITKQINDRAPAFTLRYDDALRRQLIDAAQRSIHSVNSEIVYRLKSSFEQDAAP
jgi:hypothetical protein